jgi:hypothetical protein
VARHLAEANREVAEAIFAATLEDEDTAVALREAEGRDAPTVARADDHDIDAIDRPRVAILLRRDVVDQTFDRLGQTAPPVHDTLLAAGK